MTASDVVRAAWRKSSYSGHANSNCVEVAAGRRAVAIRDSKNPDGGSLILPGSEWRAFLRRVKEGKFDLG
jgi:Domain of unknown function (DUF397)